jgi:hypothetical protein
MNFASESQDMAISDKHLQRLRAVRCNVEHVWETMLQPCWRSEECAREPYGVTAVIVSQTCSTRLL